MSLTKYSDDKKVQIRMESMGDYRKILYRVLPSELSLWNRWFHNEWHYLYHCWMSEWDLTRDDLYSLDEYIKEGISNLKTLGDVRAYLAKCDTTLKKRKFKLIELGKMWPDEDI